jgi:lytic cellulose monooxygenase (C1-hydroxylating)
MFGSALVALLSASEVSAHGHISEILIGNISYYGHDPTKVPWGPQPDSISWTNGASDNGPVLSDAASLASPNITCHLNGTNGVLTAPVNAGTTITVRWSDWPATHWGPVLDYMARCRNEDCTTVDKSELEFFKIAELGQLERGTVPGQAGYWANNKLRDDDFSWDITIPKQLAPGSYVLRHEIIALHIGGAEGTAQMYPQCINLVVKGSGTAEPQGVLATELYTSKDPGLLHNVFVDEWSDAEYIIPGPAVVQF